MISTLRQHVHRRVCPQLARCVSQSLADQTAWNQAPVQVTTLPNGLKVASQQSFGGPSSTGLFIDAGVRSETAATHGATKVLEKLSLLGATKHEMALELMGAELSVDAGREQTKLVVSGGDVGKSVGILADVVTEKGNLATKDAILRSLEHADAPTRSVIDDRLHQCAFRDCSLGLSTLGPFDGLNSLTEAHLDAYKSANYTADKMVLVATGAVNHADVVAQAADALGGVKTGGAVHGWQKPYFCGAELLYRNDEMGPTAYISVGVESVPWKSADAVTFMVMQHIIGSYKKDTGLVPGTISGNRVANAVANKMGVGCADEFQAFQTFYKDTGIFGWYAACDEVAVEHCVGELQFGLNLLSFSVTDEEVARGKRELKASLFGNASSSASCAEIGQHMLAYGRHVPAAEMQLRIDAVDAEEVKRVAWQYLNDAEVAVTALGPIHGFPQYMDLRRSTTMHRY